MLIIFRHYAFHCFPACRLPTLLIRFLRHAYFRHYCLLLAFADYDAFFAMIRHATLLFAAIDTIRHADATRYYATLLRCLRHAECRHYAICHAIADACCYTEFAAMLRCRLIC